MRLLWFILSMHKDVLIPLYQEVIEMLFLLPLQEVKDG